MSACRASASAVLDTYLRPTRKPKTYLLQGLVVDEASSILGDLELAFLDLLAKLPKGGRLVSVSFLAGDARYMQLSERDTALWEGGSTHIMRFWLPPSPEGLGARGGERDGGFQAQKRETEGRGAAKLSHMQQRLMATDRTGSRQTSGGAGTQGRLFAR